MSVDSGASPSVNLKLNKIFSETYATENNGIKQKDFPEDFKLKIRLKHDKPFHFSPRRLSYSDRDDVRGIIDDLLDDGVIRPSHSEYCSPIVLVRKKTGELRMCVDYRVLNAMTHRDHYPLPLIDDLLDYLQGKKVFSILDLKSGFQKVAVYEDSVKSTSFSTPHGQFEYVKMPFGLCNCACHFSALY